MLKHQGIILFPTIRAKWSKLVLDFAIILNGTLQLIWNRFWQGILKGEYHYTIDLLFDWFGLVCFANKNKNCQLSCSWLQTSQTGVQWYNDTSPFSIPWVFLGSKLWFNFSFIPYCFIYHQNNLAMPDIIDTSVWVLLAAKRSKPPDVDPY